MKTFDEIKNTRYFEVLAEDMKEVLEINEIIWESITWINFYQVFNNLFVQNEIQEDFKAFSFGADRTLGYMLRILADASEVVDAIPKMSHSDASDASGMSLYFIDYKVREVLFGEVLMYVLEENMEK